MSVHYKFKSALSFDTVTFDGLHISIRDFKKAIIHQKRIGKNTDFDLQITNAQTKEVYCDESTLIPKNTSLIVARIPLTNQQKKSWTDPNISINVGKGENSGESQDVGAHKLSKAIDLSSLDASEEDKIQAMMTQSTQDYNPSNYMKIRGANQMGEVPPNYRCYKCHQPGHWIKNCPLGLNQQDPIDIKKSTGIPRSFMVPVDGPLVPGAMITPSGQFAVPAVDHQAYKEGKKEKPPFQNEPEPEIENPEIPEDLLCSICKDLLRDAVMIACCGNSFCDECIRTALLESEENECPDCHEKDIYPNTLIPNRFLRTSVNNFKNETGYEKMCKPIRRKIIHTSPPKPIQNNPPPVIPTLSDFVAPENLPSLTESKEKVAGLKNNNEENKETSTHTENINEGISKDITKSSEPDQILSESSPVSSMPTLTTSTISTNLINPKTIPSITSTALSVAVSSTSRQTDPVSSCPHQQEPQNQPLRITKTPLLPKPIISSVHSALVPVNTNAPMPSVSIPVLGAPSTHTSDLGHCGRPIPKHRLPSSHDIGAPLPPIHRRPSEVDYPPQQAHLAPTTSRHFSPFGPGNSHLHHAHPSHMPGHIQHYSSGNRRSVEDRPGTPTIDERSLDMPSNQLPDTSIPPPNYGAGPPPPGTEDTLPPPPGAVVPPGQPPPPGASTTSYSSSDYSESSAPPPAAPQPPATASYHIESLGVHQPSNILTHHRMASGPPIPAHYSHSQYHSSYPQRTAPGYEHPPLPYHHDPNLRGNTYTDDPRIPAFRGYPRGRGRSLHNSYRGGHMHMPASIPPGMPRSTHNGTQPGTIEDPLEAFERMLREKDDRDRKLRRTRRATRSRSYSRSRSRSYSPRSRTPRSRTRSRSRTPRSPLPSSSIGGRKARSRTPRSRTRSRSFSLSRSRSRSFSRSPSRVTSHHLSRTDRDRERDYSPRRRYRSPVRSPIRSYRYKDYEPAPYYESDYYPRSETRGRSHGGASRNTSTRYHQHHHHSSSTTAPVSGNISSNTRAKDYDSKYDYDSNIFNRYNDSRYLPTVPSSAAIGGSVSTSGRSRPLLATPAAYHRRYDPPIFNDATPAISGSHPPPLLGSAIAPPAGVLLDNYTGSYDRQTPPVIAQTNQPQQSQSIPISTSTSQIRSRDDDYYYDHRHRYDRRVSNSPRDYETEKSSRSYISSKKSSSVGYQSDKSDQKKDRGTSLDKSEETGKKKEKKDDKEKERKTKDKKRKKNKEKDDKEKEAKKEKKKKHKEKNKDTKKESADSQDETKTKSVKDNQKVEKAEPIRVSNTEQKIELKLPERKVEKKEREVIRFERTELIEPRKIIIKLEPRPEFRNIDKLENKTEAKKVLGDSGNIVAESLYGGLDDDIPINTNIGPHIEPPLKPVVTDVPTIPLSTSSSQEEREPDTKANEKEIEADKNPKCSNSIPSIDVPLISDSSSAPNQGNLVSSNNPSKGESVGPLAPLPEPSKWELDELEEDLPSNLIHITKTSPPLTSSTTPSGVTDSDANLNILNPQNNKMITSEVLKRAENAIFQKAINAIRPLDRRRVSIQQDQQQRDEVRKTVQAAMITTIPSIAQQLQQQLAQIEEQTPASKTKKLDRSKFQKNSSNNNTNNNNNGSNTNSSVASGSSKPQMRSTVNIDRRTGAHSQSRSRSRTRSKSPNSNLHSSSTSHFRNKDSSSNRKELQSLLQLNVPSRRDRDRERDKEKDRERGNREKERERERRTRAVSAEKESKNKDLKKKKRETRSHSRKKSVSDRKKDKRHKKEKEKEKVSKKQKKDEKSTSKGEQENKKAGSKNEPTSSTHTNRTSGSVPAASIDEASFEPDYDLSSGSEAANNSGMNPSRPANSNSTVNNESTTTTARKRSRSSSSSSSSSDASSKRHKHGVKSRKHHHRHRNGDVANSSKSTKRSGKSSKRRHSSSDEDDSEDSNSSSSDSDSDSGDSDTASSSHRSKRKHHRSSKKSNKKKKKSKHR